jgi:membrane protein
MIRVVTVGWENGLRAQLKKHLALEGRFPNRRARTKNRDTDLKFAGIMGKSLGEVDSVGSRAMAWYRHPADVARHGWMILCEAGNAFVHHSDFRQASSLAFYSTLTLLPTLLLLTFLLGLGIGSSHAALQRISLLIQQVVPRFGEVVLREVRTLANYPRTAGTLNVVVLFWTLTPLVGSLREVLEGMFKIHRERPVITGKLMDLLIGGCFVTGLAGMAGAGVLVEFLESSAGGVRLPGWAGFTLTFAATVALVWGVFAFFTTRIRPVHLLAGAFATAVLWYLLRPAFVLLLTYDEGFGMAFGAFRSIFLVVIWIYYSLAMLLLGAEVAAALHRGETLLIRRLLDGNERLPERSRDRLILEAPAGWVFCRDGEPGDDMFFVLSGTVGIHKGGRELARVGKGKFFGEMTFLLGLERSATAVALEPCRCVVVNGQNFEALLREFPGFVREMLEEMALRLRDHSARSVEPPPAEPVPIPGTIEPVSPR